jgi:hypothetical protein
VTVVARTAWCAERMRASTPARLSSKFIQRRDGDQLWVVFYLTTRTSHGRSSWREMGVT